MGGAQDDLGALLERGRRLFAMPCRFAAAAARLDQLPDSVLPEVAFSGRSNVGKSSLINALTGRKTLAKTSNTPGRTQQLNFFDLGGGLMLADLPGYGYASAPKAKVANWIKLVEAYLCGRPSLRRTLLLIDARHGFMDIDRKIMSMLDRAGVSYQVVLTKSDKLGPHELALRRTSMAEELVRYTASHPEVLATSARTGLGVPELRSALAALADWAADPSD